MQTLHGDWHLNSSFYTRYTLKRIGGYNKTEFSVTIIVELLFYGQVLRQITITRYRFNMINLSYIATTWSIYKIPCFNISTSSELETRRVVLCKLH